jgi:predicted transcriptional regulator
MGHFNTTHEVGAVRAAYQSQAIKQEAAVLALFRRERLAMTPSEVCEALNRTHGKGWLLTSIRRSMSNLTDEGLLEKTGRKRMGPHGRFEYYWELGDGQ